MEFSKLSYGQIQSIADQLKTYSSEMESLLKEINMLFNKIGTDDVWNGTSAGNTKEMFDQLSTKFPEFSTAIAECHDYLKAVVENYKSVDAVIMGTEM